MNEFSTVFGISLVIIGLLLYGVVLVIDYVENKQGR